MYRNHEIGERPSSEGRKPVVGIVDARNALKKNIHTIVTSETGSRMSQKVPNSRQSVNIGQSTRNTPHGKFIDKALLSQKSGNTGSGSAAGNVNTEGSFSNAVPRRSTFHHQKAQETGSLIGSGTSQLPPTQTPRTSIKKPP